MVFFHRKPRFNWSSFFLGALVLWLAFFVYKEAKKEVVSWKSHSSGRIPASIPKTYDLSGLQGDVLQAAASARILSGLAVNKGEQSYFVKVGNFALLNGNQQRDFACGVYNHVSLTFEAEGVAVEGEKPILRVDGPCLTGDDLNSIAPIEIPFSEIKNQNPRQQDFSFGSSHLAFAHTPDGWPKKWALSEISLSSDVSAGQNLEKTIVIPKEQIRKQLNKSVIMNW